MKLKTFLSTVAALAALTFTSCASKTENTSEEQAAEETVEATEAATALPADMQSGIVVIDFNAEWCGPCKMLHPFFEAAAEKYAAKATFKSVDVDQQPELAEAFGATSIPLVVILKDGKEVDRMVGFSNEGDFNAFLAKSLD